MVLIQCEETIKKFLPAVKAGLVKELIDDYDLNQVEIALKLGMTQAAVSKYITGKYTQRVKKLEEDERVKSTVKKVAYLIAKGKTKKPIQDILCKFCMDIRKLDVCEVRSRG